MTDFLEKSLVVDGYAGFPVDIHETYGRARGTVEWLLDAIERHALAERDALQQYVELATASNDPVIALVMRLILEDEERHHGLLKRMEASLRDALDWTYSPEALPSAGMPHQPVASGLAETARARSSTRSERAPASCAIWPGKRSE